MKVTLLIGILAAGFYAEQAAPKVYLAPSEDTISSSVFTEPMENIYCMTLDFGRALNIEPGVRLARIEGGYSICTHDGSPIEFCAGNWKSSTPSPAFVKVSSIGWQFQGGEVRPDTIITTRRKVQDDTDTNLKSMQESAKKLKAKTNGNQDNKESGKKLRVRWLFGENPMPTAELFNTPAIQQLTHLSSIGF